MTLAGEHVRTIGVSAVGGEITGIAATADLIAVSSDCAVATYSTTSGGLIRSFGAEGPAEGQLEGCNGLRFTSAGTRLLIAEQYNNRLSLFTTSGEFVRCIGVGVLNCPVDVAFPANGDLLVSDYGNCRICVFSPDGYTLLRAFGSPGDAPGEFSGPAALALHGDKLFVLDEDSDRVQVFM